MKRYVNTYICATIILGSLLSLFSGYFIINMEQNYRNSLNIVNSIEMIAGLESEMNRKILECSYLTYCNEDEIKIDFDKLQIYTEKLFKNMNIYKKRHKKSLALIKEYRKILKEKKKEISSFINYNSSIKVSLGNIPKLILKQTDIKHLNKDRYLQLYTNILANLLLMRNNMNMNMSGITEKDIKFLEIHKPDSELDKLINYNLLKYLENFIKGYPVYAMILKNLTNIQSLNILKNLKSVYQKENEYIFTRLFTMSILFFIGIVSAVFFIIFYIRRVKKASVVDNLTGLYNRRTLINESYNNKHNILFIIDIGDFKHINNFYGIKTGDEFLKIFGKKLKEWVKKYKKAKLYRIGSDDFGILLPKYNINEPIKFAEYLIRQIETGEFKIGQLNLSVTGTIGISTETPLLEKADIALKYAKADSRLKFAVYNNEIMNFEKKIDNNMKVLKDLKKALESGKVVPYYQAIMDNKTGLITKYECLVRMFNEKNETVPPGEFLEVAKKGKLYGELTKCVVEKSFHHFKDKPCEFSVNLSVEDILDTSVKSYIFDKLNEYPELAKRLTFEILETEGIENFEMVSEFIQNVKQYGVSIAIDDFGTGYSNFSYLLQLNVDYIKIDASLIKNIHTDKNSEIIVKTIVSFAKKLNMKTVAEFVYNEEVYRKVKEIGIEYSQGFFISKPIPTCLNMEYMLINGDN